ncbi:MAG: nicotinamide riboside transporter PnuC [Cryomorphaceae bacterium]|nr:MAG: nicotinamide riboside transporter PnuC [Cryomorphaceae bacterium]|tara:strand:+ start:1099 stop:1731 length:633 start_codon:yes stop_codon:yes gene_type:complete
MSELINQVFEQYSQYSNIDISLELIAVFFGLLSVWFSKNNNVLVYPTGIINTSIFVYLLVKWELLGDMIINVYYFLMSIYGWYYWTRKSNNEGYTPITRMHSTDIKIILIIIVSSVLFVSYLYSFFEKWSGFVSYVDIITTAIFFAGMWLMARRKIESWFFWILGDIISVPLYFSKGLAFSSFQYLIFTFIAIAGYYKWKSIYNNKKQIS